MADQTQYAGQVLNQSEKHLTVASPWGSFTFRRPTLMDQLKISVQEARYRQGQVLDLYGENLAFIFATIDIVCEKPEGFSYDQIGDFEEITPIWKSYNDWVSSFRQKHSAADQAPGA